MSNKYCKRDYSKVEAKVVEIIQNTYYLIRN